MTDKIEEIRARHAATEAYQQSLTDRVQMHDDRGYLLAEVERLREALVLASEVLASHQGSPGREWHNAGAWLYPGDSINVVRAPLPEIEVVP